MTVLPGAVAVMAGAAALYLASPHQRVTARALPRRALGWAGLAGLLAGLVLLMQWAGPATSVFILVTLAALVWTVLPPAAAWISSNKDMQ